jgi:RNA polymerase sigma factor (sigma-70 family)
MDDVRQDWDLLREYLGSGSQEAFRVLVERHIGLVYAAARRRVGNAELAEDVTQAVFMILTAKAASIRQGTPLPPWLYNVTRYTCANAMKMEKRRQRHETQAAAERPTRVEETPGSNEENQILLPMLDAAIDRLGDRDRAAVLLRYFEGFSFEQVGASVGSSAHAAEVRVSRAVEKLRRFFVAKGAAAPLGEVTATLAARAADAAPPGLSRTVMAAATAHAATASVTALASCAAAGSAKAVVALVGLVVALIASGAIVIVGFQSSPPEVPPPNAIFNAPVVTSRATKASDPGHQQPATVVYILGNVPRTGKFEIVGNRYATVRQMLTAAGCPANVDELLFLLWRKNGGKESLLMRDVPVASLMNGKLSDPRVEPDDVLFVYRRVATTQSITQSQKLN